MDGPRADACQHRGPPGAKMGVMACSRTTSVTARRLRLATLLVAGLALLLATPATGQPGPTVATTQVRGPITPVIANHLADTIATAAEAGHEALIVQLDTPGGLVTSTRSIVQTLLEARIPVIVYVSPRGADAGSAGTFVTLAAHIAAMSPATTIGAATPIDLEGGEISDKVINNAAEFARAIAEERGRDVEFAVASVRDGISITADEALKNGTIDLIASDLADLLAEVDGTVIELADGSVVTLATASAQVVELD
ncbi:MAG TPA: ATP-dependent Clp protease proteolytic subunit, partial [Nitriliruptorales bacterium]